MQDNTDNWHFDQGGTPKGPLTAEEIASHIGSGEITADTLVWRPGLKKWQPARLHLNFPEPETDNGFGALAERLANNDSQRPKALVEPQAAGPQEAKSGTKTSEKKRWDYHCGPDLLYVGAPSRGFFEAIDVCLKKYARFSGRASRSEYWYFLLFSIAVGLVASAIDHSLFVGRTEEGLQTASAILTLLMILPYWSVTFRRLHDINRSGWWFGGFWLALFTFSIGLPLLSIESSIVEDFLGIWGIVMLVWIVTILVFLGTEGDLKPNRFG